MMLTYAGRPTLTNWLLQFIYEQPNGASLSRIVHELKLKRPGSKPQSVPPTLTYLKHLGLVEREFGVWKKPEMPT